MAASFSFLAQIENPFDHPDALRAHGVMGSALIQYYATREL
jgi:hypothetical protein